MSTMSESAAIVKLFFAPPLPKTALADTLQASGAEDRALQGCNLSADSGAKTRLGLGETLNPSGELYSTGIGIKAINPRGLGTASPEKPSSYANDSFRPIRSLSDSVLSSDACLRLQLLQEPIPQVGCRNH